MLKNKIIFNKGLNYILFLTIIYFNIFFYFKCNIENFHIIYLTIDLYLIFIFFLLNLKHDFDFIKGNNNIKKLIDVNYVDSDEIKGLLNTKMDYIDNKDNFRLFKNLFIKKNLLTKDYNDLKKTFLKFIPEDYINEIGYMGIDKINLGASVRKYFTVLFLDIIGFTTLTENISHDKALEVLNTYFDGIVDIIKSYGGYVDKFLGDGILIIFDNNVSDDAINASIKIQEFVLKNPIIDIGKNISVGIGINSGEVILGTIGSKNRMEITIIGDVVNTASRIEGLTRELNEKIIISDRTYSNIINKNQFFINELGYKSLKGKKTKIKIYGIASKLNKKI